MKKSTIPFFLPFAGEPEKKMVLDVIDSNYLNDGHYSRTFEKKFAALLRAKYCVATTSGTAAIALSLMGLGIGRGDEVIVPDMTFIATANAARLAGADVKLMDVDPRRFLLDAAKLKRSVTKKTKAIITVDVNGRGADYDTLVPFAKSKGLALVCDSTEAIGSKRKGKFLGTYGDAGCFSFSSNKTISTGQGGMIATNNRRLYERLLELKDHGRRFQGTGGDDAHPVLGFNFKFTNLQAAIGLAQLDRLNGRLTGAQNREKWYKKHLGGFPGLNLNNEEGEITQWTDILIDDRKGLERILKSAKIGCRAFWHPLHRQIPYAKPDANFKNTISVSTRGLWLPSYFDLTEDEVIHISKVVLEFVRQKR